MLTSAGMRLSRRAVLIAACALLGGASSALAQGFPSKPVRIVVPYAAGGTADAATRIVASKLIEVLGQNVVVENRTGAGGAIGAAAVAKAEADGHVLLMTAISHVVLPNLVKDLPFDPIRDFAPVIFVASVPNVLVTSPRSGMASVAEVVARARANPGKLTFASAGNGTLSHLLGEWFKRAAAIDIIHIPYRGGGPALTDVMGGQVDMIFDTLTTTAPNARAGNVRPLAVTSARRSATLPDTPTMIEAGYRDFVGTTWLGLLAPAATPPATIASLNAAVERTLASAELKEALAKLGTDTEGGPPDRFARLLEAEAARWGALVKEAGITAD